MIFNKKNLLKPQSLEDSKKECAEIKATPEEIKQARKLVNFICVNCGYHQDKSWDGKIRKCSVCGGNLKFWRLSERIKSLRESS